MTAVEVPLAVWRPSLLARKAGFAAALAVLALLVVAAAAPSLLTSLNPDAANVTTILRPPSAAHLLGTDQDGRDIYARIVYGARPSLLIGTGAVALALAGGVVVGTAAAMLGKVTDQVLSRLLDVVLSIPGLLLVFLVVAVFGRGIMTAAAGLGVVAMPGFARVTRAEVITLRGSAYVEAARHFGWSRWQVTARHILPNALGPVIALATISLGAMIVASSSLSFLGLGPQPPTADWGAMLSDSQDYLALAWWPAVFPGVAITIAILVITLIGRRLRDRTDRRQA